MSPSSADFIPIAAPEIGVEEEEAVLRVLRSGRLASGPEVEALEAEFAAASGVGEAVAIVNGTAAIHAGLLAVGIGPGDEVLVPAFTFAASAGAVVAAGARPVFVDIGADYLIDLDDAAQRLSPSTAAIMPVHLYGLMADMVAVEAFASKHGLAVVEDAAQAHLARRDGRRAGGSTIGAFSLYATKNMMTGEGGMVTTDDPLVASKVRLLRNQGMAERYVHTAWGMNLRMTDLLATIGRVQLGRLQSSTDQRRRTASTFDKGLPEIFDRPAVPEGAYHVYHQYTVAVPGKDRDRVVTWFRDHGIGADVYYPATVPSQAAYLEYASDEPLPAAEKASAQVVSLPVHPGVDENAATRIITVASSFESRSDV